jgi:arylamine N-acetyltransferase
VTDAQCARYLRLLGLPAAPRGRGALAALVAAHLERVPFETVSKLCHRRRGEPHTIPELDRFLDGIEHHRFGGTCYANNYCLYRLLAHLGYEVRLCGAAMSRPDVHLVSIVTLDGREFLVDGGYGAPFLEPLPRDLDTDHVVELGRDRYVLRPQDGEGRSRLEHWNGNVLRHGYTVDPRPRRIEEFRAVIEQSFMVDATFMQTLRIVRFVPGGSVDLLDRRLTQTTGRRSRTRILDDTAALVAAIAGAFGMPHLAITEALAELEFLRAAANAARLNRSASPPSRRSHR